MRLINKDATIDKLQKEGNANIAEPVGNGVYRYTDDYKGLVHAVSIVEDMPEEQSEITLESAIDYLHSIGWMQEHDRILTESVQFEPNCKGCKHQPRFSHEEPCCTCANNYENKYQR